MSLTAVDFVCPEKKSLFVNISLCARNVTRRIEDIFADVKLSLAQVDVFIRGINAHLDIIEEFASLVPLKDTTTGLSILMRLKVL